MTQRYRYETILTEATPWPLSLVQVYSDSSGLVVSKSGAIPQLQIKFHQYTRTKKPFCNLFTHKNLFFSLSWIKDFGTVLLCLFPLIEACVNTN